MQGVIKSYDPGSGVGSVLRDTDLAEIELAEKLQGILPCAELLRFSVTGSEADHTAFRVARAVTAQTGLRCVFHHHCAGFVETPDEIAISILAEVIAARNS